MYKVLDLWVSMCYYSIMPLMRYIEDIFLELANIVIQGKISHWHADTTPIMSFHSAVTGRGGITQKQSEFMLKLVKKYRKDLEKSFGVDLQNDLDNPVWKNPFREIDYSRKISIETDENKIPYIHIRFPFSLKEDFQKEFSDSRGRTLTVWDNELKVQKAPLFKINHIQLYEFGKKNNFEFSENFLNLIDIVEEIWSDDINYLPHCVIDNDQVILNNANSNAISFFEKEKTNQLISDLFLARSMGYVLEKSPKNTEIFKIFSSQENAFWVGEETTCARIVKELDTYPIVIFLDRSSDVITWTKNMIKAFHTENIDTSAIRVCFRFLNDDPVGSEFNQWVRDNNLGGSVSTGKIFICQHKPPKWMLKDDFSPKIMISNALYPHTNTTVNTMIVNHHTVLFVGKIRPTSQKETKIVEL